MEFITSTISRIDLMISFSDMKFCQNIKPHINIYSYNCTGDFKICRYHFLTMEESHVKYLMSNDQDMLWGMVVTTAGHQNIPPQAEYPSRNHPTRYLFSTEKGRVLNEYQLVYITRGRGQFVSTRQKECEIREGDMFLLFPGEWHNYRPDPHTGWHESWVGFKGPDIEKRVAARFFVREKAVFSIGIHEEIYHLYRWAATVAQQQGSGHQQILAGIVNLLLGFAYSEDRQMAFRDKNIDGQIAKAKILMQENIEQNLPGEAIARQIGMGYSWFRRIFKEYTGFAPNQYMQELKISKSKELLTNSEMNCQQIAYAVGFETPSYFNIVFKKKTGMTPSKYREFTQGSLLKPQNELNLQS